MTFDENEADREPPEQLGRLFYVEQIFHAKAQSAAAF